MIWQSAFAVESVVGDNLSLQFCMTVLCCACVAYVIRQVTAGPLSHALAGLIRELSLSESACWAFYHTGEDPPEMQRTHRSSDYIDGRYHCSLMTRNAAPPRSANRVPSAGLQLILVSQLVWPLLAIWHA